MEPQVLQSGIVVVLLEAYKTLYKALVVQAAVAALKSLGLAYEPATLLATLAGLELAPELLPSLLSTAKYLSSGAMGSVMLVDFDGEPHALKVIIKVDAFSDPTSA
jgi:hypothetical protein